MTTFYSINNSISLYATVINEGSQTNISIYKNLLQIHLNVFASNAALFSILGFCILKWFISKKFPGKLYFSFKLKLIDFSL
jgi:hypothetical protein